MYKNLNYHVYCELFMDWNNLTRIETFVGIIRPSMRFISVMEDQTRQKTQEDIPKQTRKTTHNLLDSSSHKSTLYPWQG